MEHKTSGDIFLRLLNKFCSNDNIREWMKTPFNVGDRTVATNGYCLLATPLQDGFVDRSENIKTVYPIEHNISKPIAVNDLKQKVKDFPVVDFFDEIETRCDACNGEGEVEFEFYHSCETYRIEHDCPVCDGKGIITTQSKTPNGKKQLDYSLLFKIGISTFNVGRIEELIYVADSLNVELVNLVNQTEPNRPSLFTIKDVEMIIMPTICNDKQNVAQYVS